MSVHTNMVYLREMNGFSNSGSTEPKISNVQSVLRTVDFARLTHDIGRGHLVAGMKQIGDAVISVQDAGADFLVVTANTIGSMLGMLGEPIIRPVLDITAPVFVQTAHLGLTKLGLLSTATTAESGMHQRIGRAYGCQAFTGPWQLNQQVNDAIFTRLVRGVLWDEDAAILREGIEWFAVQGAEAVIPGCTDLTLLTDHLGSTPIPLWDSTLLHVHAAEEVAVRGNLPRYMLPVELHHDRGYDDAQCRVAIWVSPPAVAGRR